MLLKSVLITGLLKRPYLDDIQTENGFIFL